MQDIIERILEGNFDYEGGSLDFSCAKVELNLQRGEAFEGSFRIFSTPGCPTYGTVISSDLRMECLTPSFTGADEEIAYRFHGPDLEEGDVIKGEFCVISNQGEYYLPFVVTVEHTVLPSSIGGIKNLFHFANLAKSNWREALGLFYAPEFERIFEVGDRLYFDCYRGLSANPGNEQNMEEFLMQINKKQKVEYITEEKSLALDNPLGVTEAELTIVRNGWGYTHLDIQVEGDFLFTEKEMITDDDFLGNYFRLPVFVDSSLCRRGRNFGRIVLSNPYLSLTVPVAVRVGEGRGAAGNARVEKKRILVQLMEFYQAFRMKKIGTATWLTETGKLVERMVVQDEKDVSARLFQAQLLITEDRLNEAGWLLDHAAELLARSRGLDDKVLRAYYLYLTTLISREEGYVDRVAEEVRQIYLEDRSSWRVAWLLLYLSEDYNRSASGKWAFLEKQFQRGCTSPILYIEALLLLIMNPALLRRLGEFELQVLNYGRRQEALTEELIEQLLYLSGKNRSFSLTLLCILESCYYKKTDDRVLQEICSLLIKGEKTERKYFKWYKRGVEKELRITRLYEYFMLSIDMEEAQTLPRLVLMYFSYQSSLDWRRTSYLYSYVLHHRDGFEELYGNYLGRMERFVMEQLQKGRINRHLAYLYQELLTPQMIGEQNAGVLAALLFTCAIQVDEPFLTRAIVYRQGSLRAQEYPLEDGRCFPALYGNDYTLLFEDGAGRRYIKNVVYTTERLMSPGRFLRHVIPFVRNSLELDLYLCESAREGAATAEWAERYLRLAESGEVSPEVRREACLKALRYYYEQDDMRQLDGYLERISMEELSNAERSEVLRYMVLRGKCDVAYRQIEEYGPYFADPKTLVRLISQIMQQTDFVENPVLTASARCAFRHGKYDGNVLHYLTLYFAGMTKDMRDIWKAAKSFGVDSYELSEKILLQMLYTGAFVGEKMEIFRYYVSQGAKAKVEEAFLAQCSYDFFVKQKVTEKEIFEEIYNAHVRGEAVQKICRLAFLKYYAENRRDITPGLAPVIREFLTGMLTEGVHLNFFKELKDFPELLHRLSDKTIIEYRAHPQSRAYIHYVMSDENGEAGEYLTDEMTPVYGGVCFREFVLFFGESLQYYIVEVRDGAEELTESGTIQKSDVRSESEDNEFELINDIVISKTLQDYDTLDCLLEEYYWKEFVNGEVFSVR